MTDVPFVSVSNIAFFFIVRGLSRKSSFELWLGCAFGACAFFIRQIAIAIPGAVLLYVVFAPSFRSRRYILPPLIVSLFICLMPILIAQTFGLTNQYTERTWVLYKWRDSYELEIPGLLRVIMHSGLALIPMTVPVIASFYRRSWFWGVICVLLLLTACSVLFSPEFPKPLEGMWRLITLGKERDPRLIHGLRDPDFLPAWLNYPLFAFSLFSSAAIITKVIDIARSATDEPLRPFVWYAVSQLILIMVLWLFDAWGSDRYSIVLLPPLTVILAHSQLKSKSTIAGIAVLSLIAMLVTWNETRNHRAVAEGVAWLRAKDIPLADIDAGYAPNGWNLYAHPENLTPGMLPERDVPFVTTDEKKPYVIATSPIGGYRVLREYSWAIPFRSVRYKIYVLEQLPQAAKNKG
jgi:hypothetical protein